MLKLLPTFLLIFSYLIIESTSLEDAGKPQEIFIETISQTALRVHWKPPLRDEWNGEILGYYVGYKPTSSDYSYIFETVYNIAENGDQTLDIKDLKSYTQYSFVIQAFNRLRVGPLSDEKRQYTAEGVPEQPPKNPKCTTLTSQTIRVSWEPPSIEFGVIKGYKVFYAPSDEKKQDHRETSSSDIVLNGLEKYQNYTIQVLAFTSAGNGVKSSIINCQTDQDTPEAPAQIKALTLSSNAVLVSWRPPTQPNGIITKYKVYFKKRDDKEENKLEISANQMSYEALGLTQGQQYEFWVSAATQKGEGQVSERISATPSDKVPAKIASFDDTFTATFKEDVKLPCLAVGLPNPVITWKIKGGEFQANDRISQLPEGSIYIKNVNRQDAGEYTCHAENLIAKDSITYKLVILAPPLAPQVIVDETTNDSITFKLTKSDSDIAPLRGFTLHYKPEYGDWETAEIAVETEKYLLEDLLCGTPYQVYATAFNSIGTNEKSEIFNLKTNGSKPIAPEKSSFIRVSSSSVTLILRAWKDGGCRILYYAVEHQEKNQRGWNLISNNVKPGGNFMVLDLEPATSNIIKITAHNNAGYTVAKYEFETLE